MKYSTNYIFYPDNHFLVNAINSAKDLLTDISILQAEPVTDVTYRDTSIHMHGNFDQHEFNVNALPNLRDALTQKIAQLDKTADVNDWARYQNLLALINAGLSQELKNAALFESSIEIANEVLTTISQDDNPFQWALAQYILGTASQELGRLNDNKKQSKVAVDAYTDALLVWTREDNPIEWSATMYQLGSTFHIYGNQLTGNRTHQKAVVAFKNALLTLDADNFAIELAATHNSRGAVLHNLGESEENAGRIEEALRSYETALTVLMEQQKPFHLAILCRINIATANYTLAQLKNDPMLAEEAADSYEVVLEGFTEACEPEVLDYCAEQLKITRAFTVQ